MCRKGSTKRAVKIVNYLFAIKQCNFLKLLKKIICCLLSKFFFEIQLFFLYFWMPSVLYSQKTIENHCVFFWNSIVFSCVYGRLAYYSVFQGFRQAKSANGGLILSSSQFLILSQLPQKMKLASKVVKVDSKIIISLPKI